MFLDPNNRNEGTKNRTTVQETGTSTTVQKRNGGKKKTRAHSPKPRFYKTALLFPLENKLWGLSEHVLDTPEPAA